MVELDEFEILEEFADNMSFCSNSSIVTKGLKGLQSDRILAGQLPSVIILPFCFNFIPHDKKYTSKSVLKV